MKKINKLPDGYNSWSGMKARCNNKNNPNYRHYGGRGISICERWTKSFELFISDMGPRPSKIHSIERVDNDKNYEPKNCIWATPKDQSCNQRKRVDAVRIEYGGSHYSVREASIKIGIPESTIRNRLVYGWSANQIFETPINQYKIREIIDGK